MLRKIRLFIIAPVLWIFLIYGKPNETFEFIFILTCLFFPLWVANCFGAACFETIYEIISRIAGRVIKNPLWVPFQKYVPAYIFKGIKSVIIEVMKIMTQFGFVIIMAKTYWYDLYFNRLTVEGINIPDLMRLYVAVVMLYYLAFIPLRMIYREETAKNVQPVQ